MKCDLCNKEVSAYVDGKTKSGIWAIMCFTSNGIGLGTGKGQMYENGKKIKG